MPDDRDPEPLTLTTADGVTLEAELQLPPTESAGGTTTEGAVVLAHPHPLQGGSMTSLVTSELFRLLPEQGLGVVRFNFRGVGRSTGEHGYGHTEGHDITAAIDALIERWTGRPLILCGWSFGADVSLSLTDPRLDGWVGIAPPLRTLPVADLAAAAGADPRPSLLIVGEHDQFLVPDAARTATEGWEATTVEAVPGADHFFVGRTQKVAELVTAFAGSLARGS